MSSLASTLSTDRVCSWQEGNQMLRGQSWLLILHSVSCNVRNCRCVINLRTWPRIREKCGAKNTITGVWWRAEQRFCSVGSIRGGKREGKVHWVVQSPRWISELFYNAVSAAHHLTSLLSIRVREQLLSGSRAA